MLVEAIFVFWRTMGLKSVCHERAIPMTMLYGKFYEDLEIQ